VVDKVSECAWELKWARDMYIYVTCAIRCMDLGHAIVHSVTVLLLLGLWLFVFLLGSWIISNYS